MIGPRGTPLVLVFFLQSAGNNVKQRKVQGPMPKLGESA